MSGLPLTVAPAYAAPRFVPVLSDAMEPGIRMGAVLAVVPIERYRGPGLYYVERHGAAELIRVEHLARSTLRLSQDGKPGTSMVVSRAWFEAAVLGQVGAVCRVLDHALMGL